MTDAAYPSREGIEQLRPGWDREREIHGQVVALGPKSSAEFVALEEVIRAEQAEKRLKDARAAVESATSGEVADQLSSSEDAAELPGEGRGLVS